MSDVERELPTPSYSIQTIAALTEGPYPEADVKLLIGGDQLERFSSWHRANAILSACDLIVVPRDKRIEGATWRSVLADELGLGCSLKESQLVVLEPSAHPASSSEIRAIFEDQTPLPAGWLAPTVLKFIVDQKLYLPAAG